MPWIRLLFSTLVLYESTWPQSLVCRIRVQIENETQVLSQVSRVDLSNQDSCPLPARSTSLGLNSVLLSGSDTLQSRVPAVCLWFDCGVASSYTIQPRMLCTSDSLDMIARRDSTSSSIEMGSFHFVPVPASRQVQPAKMLWSRNTEHFLVACSVFLVLWLVAMYKICNQASIDPPGIGEWYLGTLVETQSGGKVVRTSACTVPATHRQSQHEFDSRKFQCTRFD